MEVTVEGIESVANELQSVKALDISVRLAGRVMEVNAVQFWNI